MHLSSVLRQAVSRLGKRAGAQLHLDDLPGVPAHDSGATQQRGYKRGHRRQSYSALSLKKNKGVRRLSKATLKCADLFCGGGGTSEGLSQACESVGRKLDLLAVNHWPVAVETHAANHPGARHLCASLDNINPTKEFRGKLDLREHCARRYWPRED
jgi:hypothetical protein